MYEFEWTSLNDMGCYGRLGNYESNRMTPDIYIDPTRESFDAFKALPRDTPIHMLNLLRFNDVARYPDGHSHAGRGMSGAEAYAEYGRTSAPIFSRVGGSVIWRGTMEAVVTGPMDKNWELAFIAAYPDAGAFFEMIADPGYKNAVVHRQAAVLTSRLIRFAPRAAHGDGFA
jgi:uncharacterized protein (DUF1330 family)